MNQLAVTSLTYNDLEEEVLEPVIRYNHVPPAGLFHAFRPSSWGVIHGTIPVTQPHLQPLHTPAVQLPVHAPARVWEDDPEDEEAGTRIRVAFSLSSVTVSARTIPAKFVLPAGADMAPVEQAGQHRPKRLRDGRLALPSSAQDGIWRDQWLERWRAIVQCDDGRQIDLGTFYTRANAEAAQAQIRAAQEPPVASSTSPEARSGMATSRTGSSGIAAAAAAAAAAGSSPTG